MGEFEDMASELQNATTFTPTESGRDKAYLAIMNWVADHGNRGDPLLVMKIEAFKSRARSLAEHANPVWDGIHFRLEVHRDDQETLRQLTRGTLWFDGNPEAETMVVAELGVG